MSSHAAYQRQQPVDFSLGSLVELLFRHKKKVILLPLLSIGLGMLVIYFYPRTYASEAKLFLQVGRESVGLDPTATTGQTISLMQSSREDEVKSAIELMTSRGVIVKVVEQMTPEVILGQAGSAVPAKSNAVAAAFKKVVGTAIGFIKDIDPISIDEEAAIEIEDHLEASAERGSTIIVCKYESTTPELAQQILNGVIEEYQREHARIHRNQNSLDFFVKQRDELRQHLNSKTQTLRDRKNELGLASIEGRKASLELQLQGVDLARFTTEQDLSTAQAHVAQLQTQLRHEPEREVSERRSVPNDGADLMRDTLYSLKVKEKDYRARYNESHPMLLAIQDQVAAAQAVIDQEESSREETTENINLIHQQLTLELRQELARIEGLKSRLEATTAQHESVMEQMRQLNVDEVSIAELQQEEAVLRANWTQYSENLEQARMDSQREVERVSNISIAQAATLTHKPVSPSKALVGLASLMLASAGTLACVMASEKMNRKLRTREEIEGALGVPLVGKISKNGEQRQMWAGAQRN